MCMSHAASHQHPESRATERCPSIARARNQHGGDSPGVVARFRALATSSLSLSPRSSGDRAQRATGQPAVPITLKVSADVVRQLRAYAAASGLTMGEIVARSVIVFLADRSKHG